MQATTAKELALRLIEAGFTAKYPIAGCEEDDISELEHRFSVKLPNSYKQFLYVMGRKAGDFLNDGSWLYPLENSMEDAKSLLETSADEYSLPEKAFVFLSRDNFFLFFDTTSGDEDPPIYIFEENDKKPRKFFDSFSEWLSVCVNEEIRMRNKLNAARAAKK